MLKKDHAALFHTKIKYFCPMVKNSSIQVWTDMILEWTVPKFISLKGLSHNFMERLKKKSNACYYVLKHNSIQSLYQIHTFFQMKKGIISLISDLSLRFFFSLNVEYCTFFNTSWCYFGEPTNKETTEPIDDRLHHLERDRDRKI